MNESARKFLSTQPFATGEIDDRRAPKIPGYEFVRVLGEGGMGVVWLATQTEPVRRDVAIKVVNSARPSEKMFQQFLAERQALAQMDHPNIAKVFETGITDMDEPFFAMEYIDGIPVTQFAQDNNLSLTQRLELACDVCLAIEHAHQKGVIHRDIKPSNVLVTQVNGKAIVKVIDFGLAKALEDSVPLTAQTERTEFGNLRGTPLYMSPEQARMDSRVIDTRSDIYSAGVLTYELVTGTTPIEAQRFDEFWHLPRPDFIEKFQNHQPNLPSRKVRELDNDSAESKKWMHRLEGDVDCIVMKAIEKDPQRRYPTADAFHDDLQRYLAGYPIQARPATWVYRLRKLYQRKKSAVWIAFLATATTVTLLISLAIKLVSDAHLARQELIAAQDLQLARQKTDELRITQWANRAQWNSIIDETNAIENEKGVLDSCQLQFARVAALHGLNRNPDSLRLVEAIEQQPNLSQSDRAKALLWKGILLRLDRTRIHEATESIQKSLSMGLGDKDKAYAESILLTHVERDADKANKLLREILMFSPFDERAALDLIINLFFIGKHDVAQREIEFAKRQFGQKAQFVVLEYLIAKSKDIRESERMLDTAVLDESHFKVVTKLGDCLHLLNQVAREDLSVEQTLHQFREISSANKESKQVSVIGLILNHPSMQAFFHFADELSSLTNKVRFNYFRQTNVAREILDRCFQKYPDGIYPFLKGQSYLFSGQRDYKKAAACFQQATSHGSMVPSITIQALYAESMSRFGVGHFQNNKTEKQKAMKLAVKFASKGTDVKIDHAVNLATILTAYHRFELARSILGPHLNDPSCIVLAVDNEFRAKQTGRAADLVRRLKPQDVGKLNKRLKAVLKANVEKINKNYSPVRFPEKKEAK